MAEENGACEVTKQLKSPNKPAPNKPSPIIENGHGNGDGNGGGITEVKEGTKVKEGTEGTSEGGTRGGGTPGGSGGTPGGSRGTPGGSRGSLEGLDQEEKDAIKNVVGSYRAGAGSGADSDGDDDDSINRARKALSPKSISISELLTPEEHATLSAREKGHLLSKRLHQRKLEQEKERQRQEEKSQFHSQKLLADARRQLAEAEERRLAAEVIREREEARLAKERQMELVRQEYRERFGKEMPDEGGDWKKVSARDQCCQLIGKLLTRKKSSDREEGEKIDLCCQTLKVYLSNLKNNPVDPKFRKIRIANKIFAEKVAPYPEAIELLEKSGFQKQQSEDGESILQVTIPIPDGFVLGESIKFLTHVLNSKTKS